MNTTVNPANHVYDFVERLKAECQKQGSVDLYQSLERALHLGSSGLEVMGAIRMTLNKSRTHIEQMLGSAGSREVESIVAYIDNLYGPSPTYN